ncbi:MAG: response regulator transcription factor [Mucilaginibacter sp.]|nr:response regulator transcription factor [Mucilaginibacter sp.]
MINCLVVDDEPIARSGMLEYIEQIDFLHPVDVCKNAIEASLALQNNRVDLIFLDIQMPKITGVSFLKNLANPPMVIFTTAFPEYAIEGYTLNVLDYLLKPISFDRFFMAVNKAQAQLSLKRKQETPVISGSYFFIKSNQKLEKINIEEILYIEAMSNYVILYTRSKKHIVYMSFKSIESQLPPDSFLRIHKSFIVAVNAIVSIDSYEVTVADKILPISKSYRNVVMERIGKDLFKR